MNTHKIITTKLIYVSLFMLSCLVSCSDKKAEVNNTSEEEIATTEYLKGKKIYESRCANCHKNDGKGMGALFPPIAGSDYLASNVDNIICSIKYGSNKEIVVNGKNYKMPMPPQADLNDVEISDVMNYILNSWGNKLGPIELEEVKTALSNCK